MRVSLLDPLVLDRMAPTALSAHWRTALQHGGYFVDVRAGATAAGFAAIRAELAGLEDAERDLVVTSSPIAWLTGTVPKGVWWAFGVAFLGMTAFGEYTYGAGVLIGLVATPVVLLPITTLGLGLSVLQEALRRRAHAAAHAHRVAHGRALYAEVEALALVTFVMESGGVCVVSAPHLAWATHRLRDLRIHRRPVEPPERATLVAELEAARDRMEAALRAVATGAPLAEADLTLDLPRLSAAYAALGVPPDRSGEGTRLAAGLTGGVRTTPPPRAPAGRP